MNPYLRQDIEEQITEYWRDIHKNKWSIVSREYEYTTCQLKKDLDTLKPNEVTKDGIFYGDLKFIFYIKFHRGKPSLYIIPITYYFPIIRHDNPVIARYPVLQRYLEDMKTRWKYHGR